MEHGVAIELLNGMPLVIFAKWLILAMAGALTYLLIRITYVLGPFGPKVKFSWPLFMVGFLKLIVTLIVAPWIILYFEDAAPVIMEIVFGLPGQTEGEHLQIELNGVSSFGLGFLMDFIIHKAYKKIKNGK